MTPLPGATSVVHLREEYDVYIGRACPGLRASEFCNPFRIGPDGNRQAVLEKYREHLDQWLKSEPQVALRFSALKGKRLGCWCKPAACHGDIIAELLDGRPAAPLEVAHPSQLALF